MAVMKQYSFAGGEVSAELEARADLQRRRIGLRACTNFVVSPVGAVKNRAGFHFIREVKDSSKAVRLLPFVFSRSQAYAVEMGEGYIRFHRNGGTVTDPGGAHDGGDNQSSLTDMSRRWKPGALVGYVVHNDTKSESATITANTSTNVTGTLSGGADWDDGDTYSIKTSGGALVPLELDSPYIEDDLLDLRYVQQNDVMTVVHPLHQPRELKRFEDDDWSFEAYEVTVPVLPPTGVTLTNTTVSDATHPRAYMDWVVTSVDAQGRESLPTAPTGSSTDYAITSDFSKPKLTWTAPSSGSAPVEYNIYRGREGVYGYVGTVKAPSSGSPFFYDDANIPDYSDRPPEQRDPFVNTESEASGTIEVTFSGTVADKTTTPQAFDDNYTYYYSVTLDEYENITLAFNARVIDTDPWTELGTAYHENEPFVPPIPPWKDPLEL